MVSFGHTGPERMLLFNIGRIGARQSADPHFGEGPGRQILPPGRKGGRDDVAPPDGILRKQLK
jgi:hypothetical protein